LASLAVSLLGGGVVAELVDQQISLVAKSKPRLWISVFQENSWGNVQFVATLAGLQILIARGPNHSDNAGLHCWIQREAGDGLLELPVDEERGHSSVGKRRRSVIV